MLILILFAILAGAGTALSPCVLPLLPAKQRQLPEADWLERESLVACVR